MHQSQYIRAYKISYTSKTFHQIYEIQPVSKFYAFLCCWHTIQWKVLCKVAERFQGSTIQILRARKSYKEIKKYKTNQMMLS